MGDVASLFPCRCGATGRRRTLVYEGDDVAVFDACDDCIAASDELLTRVRPVFLAMVAAGVDRDIANEAMSFLLNRMQAK